jgi:hypothetical protein
MNFDNFTSPREIVSLIFGEERWGDTILRDITRNILEGSESNDKRFGWSRQALYNTLPGASSFQTASQESSADAQSHSITN